MEALNTIKEVLAETESRMSKSVESVKKEFASLRTGRANIALVESIVVDYYGSSSPLKSIASLSIPDPKTIAIQPWDASAVAEVEKAINKSDLGLNPIVDGKIIRISVPQLTDERRDEISKLIKKISEEGRVSVRTSRHEANEGIKRLEGDKTITEDELFTSQKSVQKLTDGFISQIDELLSKKEKDIREI